MCVKERERNYLGIEPESDTSLRYGEVGITVSKFANRSVGCSSIDLRIFAFFKFYSVQW